MIKAFFEIKKRIKIIFYFFSQYIKFYSFYFLYKFHFYNEYTSEFLLSFFVDHKLINSIKSNNFSVEKNRKIFSETKILYKKFAKLYPENPNLHISMSLAYVLSCKKNFLDCNEQLINLQNKLSKKYKKNYLVIEPGYSLLTIGSVFTLDAWIKSIKLGFAEKKQLILPIPDSIKKPANPTMLKYLSKYIKVIKGNSEVKKYLPQIKRHQCYHSHFINIKNKKIPFAHSSSVFVQNIWNKKKSKPLFNLNKEDLIKGKKILEEMGVKRGSWFVTTHVRDASFKNKEDYRDSDINSFYEAYKEIIDNSGYVIRMGDSGMNSVDFNFKDNKFIDYAKSKFKDHFMDVFLCAQAKFMLGTSSGLSAISYIFGTQIALVNYVPTSTIYLRKGDIFTPPLFIDRRSNKKLSFKKTMSTPYSLGIIDGAYENILNVKLKKNSKEDIKFVAKKMIETLVKKKKYSKKEEKIQNKFKKITLNNETLLGAKISIPCRISKYFLQKNCNLL